MTDNRRQIPKEIGRPIITPPLPKPQVGEANVTTFTIGQINAARRRNALKQVRELIKEHKFSMDEIQRNQE